MERPSRKEDKYWDKNRRFQEKKYLLDLEKYIDCKEAESKALTLGVVLRSAWKNRLP